MTGGDRQKYNANMLATRLLQEVSSHWRLLLGAALAFCAVAVAIELSDRQGRHDLPAGYAVRMTCEQDPESALWNGGCDRVAADIGRTDKPSFIELYRAFVTVHHRHIPSAPLQREIRAATCDAGFELDTALKGTRYVFIPLRPHFAGVCTATHARAVMDELDARDRALLAIEREGLSQEALIAGALANLTEPLVILAGVLIVAALVVL
jgi:hypothetical protein